MDGAKDAAADTEAQESARSDGALLPHFPSGASAFASEDGDDEEHEKEEGGDTETETDIAGADNDGRGDKGGDGDGADGNDNKSVPQGGGKEHADDAHVGGGGVRELDGIGEGLEEEDILVVWLNYALEPGFDPSTANSAREGEWNTDAERDAIMTSRAASWTRMFETIAFTGGVECAVAAQPKTQLTVVYKLSAAILDQRATPYSVGEVDALFTLAGCRVKDCELPHAYAKLALAALMEAETENAADNRLTQELYQGACSLFHDHPETGGSPTEAECYAGLARCSEWSGTEPESALHNYQAALELWKKSEHEAQYGVQISGVHHAIFELQQSMSAFRDSLATAKQLLEWCQTDAARASLQPEDVVVAHALVGSAHMNLGRLRAAAQSYDDALEELSIVDGAGESLNGLQADLLRDAARIQSALGHPTQARRMLERSMELLTEMSDAGPDEDVLADEGAAVAVSTPQRTKSEDVGPSNRRHSNPEHTGGDDARAMLAHMVEGEEQGVRAVEPGARSRAASGATATTPGSTGSGGRSGSRRPLHVRTPPSLRRPFGTPRTPGSARFSPFLAPRTPPGLSLPGPASGPGSARFGGRGAFQFSGTGGSGGGGGGRLSGASPVGQPPSASLSHAGTDSQSGSVGRRFGTFGETGDFDEDRTDDQVAEGLDLLAEAYVQEGATDKARNSLLKALKIRRTLFGDNDVRVANCLVRIALVYSAEEQFDEAMEKLREAQSMLQTASAAERAEHGSGDAADDPPAHSSVAADEAVCLEHMAFIRTQQEDYSAAVELLKRAGTLWKAALDGEETHARLVENLCTLGTTHQEAEDHEAALAAFTSAVEMLERMHGSRARLSVATALTGVASTHAALGNLDAQLESLAEAATIVAETTRADDPQPEHVRVLIATATAFSEAGQDEEALEYLDQASELAELVFPSEVQDAIGGRETTASPLVPHPEVASIFLCKAQLHARTGEFEDAERMYTQALVIIESVHGTNRNIETVETQNALAAVVQQAGRPDDARHLYQDALGILTEIEVGGLDETQEATGAASAQQKESTDDNDRRRRCFHPEAVTSWVGIGVAYQAVGRFRRAKHAFEAGLAIAMEVFGETHFDVGTTCAYLSRAMQQHGDLIDAMKTAEAAFTVFTTLHKQAVEECEAEERSEAEDATCQELHREMGDMLYLHGELFDQMEKSDLAIAAYERCIAFLGAEHTSTTRKSLPASASDAAADSGPDGVGDAKETEETERLQEAAAATEPAAATPPAAVEAVIDDATVGMEDIDDSWFTAVQPSDRRQVAACLLSIAEIHRAQAKHDDEEACLKLFQKAIRVLRACATDPEFGTADDVSAFATALNDLGLVHKRMHHYQAAQTLYEESLDAMLGKVHSKIPESGADGEEDDEIQAAVAPVSDNADLATLHNNLGEVYLSLGMCREALAQYDESLRLWTGIAGEESHQVAIVLHSMAEVEKQRHQFSAAMELLQRELRVRKAVFGDDHPSIANCFAEMADVHRQMYRFDDARAAFDEALKIRQAVFGDDHKAVAVLRSTAAELLKMQGRLDEAMQIRQAALAVARAGQGEEEGKDVVLAKVLCQVGDLHVELRALEDARTMYREALAILIAAYGHQHNHREIANVHQSLANTYRRERRIMTCLEAHVVSMNCRRRLLGDRHQDVAESLFQMALVHKDTGDLAAATSLLTDALAVYEEVWHDLDHGSVSDALNAMAGIEKATGKFNEARAHYERAAAIRVAVYGMEEGHPRVAACYTNRGALEDVAGNPELAAEHCQRAVDLMRKSVGEQSLEYATCLINLGAVHQSGDRLDEAMEMYNAALEVQQRVLGDAHPALCPALTNQASVYCAQEQFDEALERANRSLSIRTAAFGERDPQVAMSMSTVAAVLCEKGDLDGAYAMHKRAYDCIVEAHGDTDHIDAGLALFNMAGVKELQHRPAVERRKLLLQALNAFRVSLGPSHPRSKMAQSALQAANDEAVREGAASLSKDELNGRMSAAAKASSRRNRGQGRGVDGGAQSRGSSGGGGGGTGSRAFRWLKRKLSSFSSTSSSSSSSSSPNNRAPESPMPPAPPRPVAEEQQEDGTGEDDNGVEGKRDGGDQGEAVEELEPKPASEPEQEPEPEPEPKPEPEPGPSSPLEGAKGS